MYATQQDIVDRHGEDLLWVIALLPADPEVPESEDAIDDTAVDRALNGASNEIDTYINARYEMPLATVPPILVDCCVDIAIYHLATGTKCSDDIKERYKNRIAMLARISKGDADLGLPKAQKPQPSGGAGIVQEGRSDFGSWSP
jgi:phage gp36-like protein